MYLKKTTVKTTGRTYLSIVHGYWDASTKVSRTKTIQKLGWLDELEKEYDNPVIHFEQVVAEKNRKRLESERKTVTIAIGLDEKLHEGSAERKNLGYAVLSRIYHELGLHTFFVNRSRHLKVEYDLNSIVKLLVFERVLEPGSKKKAHEHRLRYFEHFDLTLDDIYRSLSHINKHQDALQLWVHRHIKEQYQRNTEVVYYDVTNYYFEIDEPDAMRRKGVSKEHRPDPIIQMGLFMDKNGLPITYHLFPGNTNDCETLIPTLKELKRDYELGRIIVVADKGLNTARNCYFNTHNLKNGYVFSQSIRGGHKELKKYALSDTDYRWYDQEQTFKIKSRLHPREINLEGADGKPFKTRIDEKQVVFYSKDYDRRAKAERAEAVAKARNLVANPALYKQATSYGAAKYVKNLDFDPETGEILTTKRQPIFDEAKLRQEERFDGYYAIVTSEYTKSDAEIIEIYRGLWQIEETFKVTKSDLEARPVFLSRQDHIQAHFLICFIALVILRIIQYRLDRKFSSAKIIQSLNRLECSHIKENIYLFDYFDEVASGLGALIATDFACRFRTLLDIKNILAHVKSSAISQ